MIGRTPSGLQRLRHLHGAVQAVVVGQRERLVALLGRRPGQLDRVRGAVEERVGGVAVELDVGHEHMFAHPRAAREARRLAPLGQRFLAHLGQPRWLPDGSRNAESIP